MKNKVCGIVVASILVAGQAMALTGARAVRTVQSALNGKLTPAQFARVGVKGGNVARVANIISLGSTVSSTLSASDFDALAEIAEAQKLTDVQVFKRVEAALQRAKASNASLSKSSLSVALAGTVATVVKTAGAGGLLPAKQAIAYSKKLRLWGPVAKRAVKMVNKHRRSLRPASRTILTNIGRVTEKVNTVCRTVSKTKCKVHQSSAVDWMTRGLTRPDENFVESLKAGEFAVGVYNGLGHANPSAVRAGHSNAMKGKLSPELLKCYANAA